MHRIRRKRTINRAMGPKPIHEGFAGRTWRATRNFQKEKTWKDEHARPFVFFWDGGRRSSLCYERGNVCFFPAFANKSAESGIGFFSKRCHWLQMWARFFFFFLGPTLLRFLKEFRVFRLESLQTHSIRSLKGLTCRFQRTWFDNQKLLLSSWNPKSFSKREKYVSKE